MVNFTPLGAAAGTSETTATANTKKTVGQDAFLQLLVAQIRNQNPLDPANGVEFLTQLAQFSQLEQSISIRDEISGLRSQVDDIIAAMPDKTTAGAEAPTGENNV